MDKIRELRRDKGLSMKKLGELVGVAESTIHHYEKGTRQPDYDTLNKIADIFNVSTDCLLGREENEPQAHVEEYIPDEYAEMITRLREDENYREVCEMLCRLDTDKLKELKRFLGVFTNATEEV